MSVYFYCEQQQIITIAEDRVICLWDAFKLERIQVIRDEYTSYVKKFTSSSFDKQRGVLYLGCQQITIYKGVTDA